jgi:hypothetical protein
MYIHMRVDWFFLLQECNARPSMDSRYAKFSSLASIVIGYWLNVFGPCTVYIAFLELKNQALTLISWAMVSIKECREDADLFNSLGHVLEELIQC